MSFEHIQKSFDAWKGDIRDFETLIVFFVTFSRFEYALKCAGYLNHENSTEPKAEPNWVKFACDLQLTFEERGLEIKEQSDYFFENEPLEQYVRIGGELGFRKDGDNGKNNNLKRLLVLVRRVRNNLFHGGKASTLRTDPARDLALINSGLVILNACLEWASKSDNKDVQAVKANFSDRLY